MKKSNLTIPPDIKYMKNYLVTKHYKKVGIPGVLTWYVKVRADKSIYTGTDIEIIAPQEYSRVILNGKVIYEKK